MTSTEVATATRPSTGITSVGIAGWLGTMSANTAGAYSTDLQGFTAWCADHGITDVGAVSPAVVTAWLGELASGAGTATGKPQTAATRARKLSAVKSFYRYLRAEGVTTVDPAPFQAPKVQRDDAVGSIDTHQAHALWNATEGKPRRRALVAVMLFCGLRVSEAVGLQVADLQEQQGHRVMRVMGKGSKPRTAVIPPVAWHAITEFLEVRGDQAGPLFATRTGAAITRSGAQREISALGASVGIEGLHPHTLRHTFATSAVDNGADVLKLATALGHASPTTTMRYVKGRNVITGSPVYAVADAILAG